MLKGLGRGKEYFDMVMGNVAWVGKEPDAEKRENGEKVVMYSAGTDGVSPKCLSLNEGGNIAGKKVIDCIRGKCMKTEVDNVMFLQNCR